MVRLVRFAFPLALAGMLGCGAVLGVGDLDAPGEAPNPGRVDGAVPDTGPSDAPAPVVDAGDFDVVVFDAGEGGYTDLAGKWAGNWSQTGTIVSGGANMQLMQDGGALWGPLEVTGGPCPRSGTIEGGFTAPDKVKGLFKSAGSGDLVLEVQVTVADGGGALSGSFLSKSSCLPFANGPVKMTRL